VGGEHDGPAEFGVGPDRCPEITPALDVHAGGRLVKDHQQGIRNQRHRESQSLLLAAGAFADAAAGDVGDAGPIAYLGDRSR